MHVRDRFYLRLIQTRKNCDTISIKNYIEATEIISRHKHIFFFSLDSASISNMFHHTHKKVKWWWGWWNEKLITEVAQKCLIFFFILFDMHILYKEKLSFYVARFKFNTHKIILLLDQKLFFAILNWFFLLN